MSRINVDDSNDWIDIEDEIKEFFFEQITGLKINVGDQPKPIDFFNILFDDALLNHIVAKTNLYAETFLNNANITRRSKIKKWTNLTLEELKKFLGVCLLMGQVKLPTERHFFHQRGLYRVPTVCKIISGRRFRQIMRYLHMEGEDEMDPLQKIRPIINLFIENIQKCYYPKQKLCINESMMSWKGSLRFKQYIQNKKHKFDVKFYELCEPSGLLLNFMPHVGKATVTEDDPGSGHCEKVVLKLMDPYLDKGHDLYMDSFYNSVSLSQKLHERRTHTTGTLRFNQKLNPVAVTKKKLKVGQACWLRKGPVYVSKWKDKSEVLMISTRHAHSMLNTTSRRGAVKIKPKALHDYNMNMVGVDRAKQLSYYSTPRKTIRWYKKVFLHLLDLAVMNAYIVHNHTVNQRLCLSLLSFRDEIIGELTGFQEALPPTLIQVERENQSALLQFGLVEEFHTPENIPQPHSASKAVFRKCRVCTKSKVRKETRVRCRDCPEKPPLCIVPCFGI